MRHLQKGRKFHRKKGQRKALFKGLINNLVLRGKVETTEAKAKEIRVTVEKLITIAKLQTIASFRLLLSRLPKKSAEKIYYDLAKRYEKRNGGYTKVMKGVKRGKGDAADKSIIELI